jgi:hypothetical protein
LIVGCWRQLLPVADRSATFDYEHAAAIHALSGGNMLNLTKCRRSDDSLFNQYKDVSKMNIKLFGKKELQTSLCFYNSTAWAINKKWMMHNKLARNMLVQTSEKAKSLFKTQDIILFDGLPLFSVVTKKELELFNSERFVVQAWNKNTVTLEHTDGSSESKTLEVPTQELAESFRPAYCTSAHRNQGRTIREPYSIYDWEKMGERMRYVSLSRGCVLKDVNIMR